MGDAKTVLLVVLALLAAAFAVAWAARLRTAANEADADAGMPSAGSIAIGALTNFFDTLGVGSYAPTTWLFRSFGMVPDRLLPGTLNVGHALPSVAQALIFIAIVEVETRDAGAHGGRLDRGRVRRGIVSRWSRRRVQLGMGPPRRARRAPDAARRPLGADALGIGCAPATGVAGNLVLGALMQRGRALRALHNREPAGMNARPPPDHDGSCAFLMPVAGMRYVERRAYAPPSRSGSRSAGYRRARRPTSCARCRLARCASGARRRGLHGARCWLPRRTGRRHADLHPDARQPQPLVISSPARAIRIAGARVVRARDGNGNREARRLHDMQPSSGSPS
jgi:hypothetical protein